jgi:hypothetical protein
MPRMNSTLKRKKSITSQAASISAWCAVFDWPSIVAAFSVERHGPARQLGGAQQHGGALLPRRARPVVPALAGALIARSTCVRPALGTSRARGLAVRHDRLERLPVRTSSPPITLGIDRSLRHRPQSCSGSSARSGEPGAYERTGSLVAAAAGRCPGALTAGY